MVVPPWFRGSTRGLQICRGHAMQRTPLPGGPVRVRNGKRMKENTKSAENTKRKCKAKKKNAEKTRKNVKKVERKKMKKNRKEFQKDVLPSKAQGETMEQWKHKIWPDSVSFQWPWHPCGTFAPAWTLVILVHFLVKPSQTWRIFPFSSLFNVSFYFFYPRGEIPSGCEYFSICSLCSKRYIWSSLALS